MSTKGTLSTLCPVFCGNLLALPRWSFETVVVLHGSGDRVAKAGRWPDVPGRVGVHTAACEAGLTFEPVPGAVDAGTGAPLTRFGVEAAHLRPALISH